MTTPLQNPTGGRQAPQPTGDGRSDAKPHLSQESREKARDTVDGVRERAADNVDRIADSVDAAASELDGGQVGQLSGYVHEIADKLGGFSRELREKSGDDMLGQVSRLAKENPALFLSGSVIAGFALTRFARASRPDASKLPVPADEARVQLDAGADRQTTTADTTPSSNRGARS